MSELPKGWEAVSLQDVAHWSSGGTPSRSTPAFYSGTVPWFKTGELGPRLLKESEEYISEEAVRESSAKVFKKGSVVLAMYGATIGKTSILGVDAATNQACAVGSPEAVGSDFLYYFLVSQEKGFTEAGKGGAQPNISQGIVKAWPMLLPPEREQVRILAKLEELLSDLDAGVAELKAARKKLGQYRQSLLKAAVEGALTADWRSKHKPAETGAQLLERILQERRTRWEAKQLAKFADQGKPPPKDWQKKYPEPVQPDTTDLPGLPEGWVWASVDQIAEVFLGKMLDKTKHTSGERLPYLRNVNVRWGSIDIDDVYEMFFDTDELERYGLLAGDVLVCEGGEPGRAAICKKEHERFKYQKALHRVRLFSMYEPELLIAFLEFIAKTGRLAKTFTGSTINHFTKESFLALQVPVPSLVEQRVIIESISQAMGSIDDQDTVITISLKQSAAQRQNILRAAFSGQLVQQDPNDEPASVLLERIRTERAQRKAPKMSRLRQEMKKDKS